MAASKYDVHGLYFQVACLSQLQDGFLDSVPDRIAHGPRSPQFELGPDSKGIKILYCRTRANKPFVFSLDIFPNIGEPDSDPADKKGRWRRQLIIPHDMIIEVTEASGKPAYYQTKWSLSEKKFSYRSLLGNRPGDWMDRGASKNNTQTTLDSVAVQNFLKTYFGGFVYGTDHTPVVAVRDAPKDWGTTIKSPEAYVWSCTSDAVKKHYLELKETLVECQVEALDPVGVRFNYTFLVAADRQDECKKQFVDGAVYVDWDGCIAQKAGMVVFKQPVTGCMSVVLGLLERRATCHLPDEYTSFISPPYLQKMGYVITERAGQQTVAHTTLPRFQIEFESNNLADLCDALRHVIMNLSYRYQYDDFEANRLRVCAYAAMRAPLASESRLIWNYIYRAALYAASLANTPKYQVKLDSMCTDCFALIACRELSVSDDDAILTTQEAWDRAQQAQGRIEQTRSGVRDAEWTRALGSWKRDFRGKQPSPIWLAAGIAWAKAEPNKDNQYRQLAIATSELAQLDDDDQLPVTSDVPKLEGAEREDAWVKASRTWWDLEMRYAISDLWHEFAVAEGKADDVEKKLGTEVAMYLAALWLHIAKLTQEMKADPYSPKMPKGDAERLQVIYQLLGHAKAILDVCDRGLDEFAGISRMSLDDIIFHFADLENLAGALAYAKENKAYLKYLATESIGGPTPRYGVPVPRNQDAALSPPAIDNVGFSCYIASMLQCLVVIPQVVTHCRDKKKQGYSKTEPEEGLFCNVIVDLADGKSSPDSFRTYRNLIITIPDPATKLPAGVDEDDPVTHLTRLIGQDTLGPVFASKQVAATRCSLFPSEGHAKEASRVEEQVRDAIQIQCARPNGNEQPSFEGGAFVAWVNGQGQYTEREKEKWKCEVQLGCNGDPTQSTTLEPTGQPLVFKLERIQQYMENGETKSGVEDGVVELPRVVVIGGFNYRKVGVIVHVPGMVRRSLKTGHYIAYVLKGEQWYCCSDDKISKATENQVGNLDRSWCVFYVWITQEEADRINQPFPPPPPAPGGGSGGESTEELKAKLQTALEATKEAEARGNKVKETAETELATLKAALEATREAEAREIKAKEAADAELATVKARLVALKEEQAAIEVKAQADKGTARLAEEAVKRQAQLSADASAANVKQLTEEKEAAGARITALEAEAKRLEEALAARDDAASGKEPLIARVTTLEAEVKRLEGEKATAVLETKKAKEAADAEIGRLTAEAGVLKARAEEQAAAKAKETGEQAGAKARETMKEAAAKARETALVAEVDRLKALVAEAETAEVAKLEARVKELEQEAKAAKEAGETAARELQAEVKGLQDEVGALRAQISRLGAAPPRFGSFVSRSAPAVSLEED